MVNKELFCKDKYTISDLFSVEGGSIAVHCPTKEQAIRFMKAMKARGVEWTTGKQLSSVPDFYWDAYKALTCYDIYNRWQLQYCYQDYFAKHGYLVIEESDILYSDEPDDIPSYEEILKGLRGKEDTGE